MNSSILVYRKVQPRSLTRALLVASLPPRPPAPPPAFLVLGQRPGSSPGESHQTAVYRRAPSRRVARVARVAPSPFARASVPPHENERKGRWYRRTRERRPARRSAGTPPTAKPTCPPCAVRVHVAAASCVCAWAWSGCWCGLAACGGPRLCVVSAVRLLTEVAFVEVADEASARSPTAKPTHPPTRPASCMCVRRLRRACVRGRGRGRGVRLVPFCVLFPCRRFFSPGCRDERRAAERRGASVDDRLMRLPRT